MDTNPFESPASEPAPVHQSFRLTRDPDAPEIPSVGSPREAFVFAMLQQAVLFLLAALLLDGGVVLRRVTIASIGFWCFVLLLLIRRRNSPTRVDIILVKYGIWPLLLITIVAAGLLGR
jgi:hypothetical protein